MKKNFIVLILLVFLSATSIGVAKEYSFKAIDAYNLGVKQTKLKSYNSAISSFKKAVSIDRTFADAYYNLASLYVMKKDYDKAIKAYSSLLKYKPNDYDAIFELAKICALKKNYSTELKYLSFIPKSYPNYPEVQRMQDKAKKLFKYEKKKYISTKINKYNPNKKIIIDKFSSPTGVVADSKGNMYVACYSSNSVKKVTGNRKISTFSKSRLLKGPIGLAIDSFDNIYVANYEANNILKISPKGKAYIFMDKIYKPYYLFIKDDVLYISEQSNNIVIKYKIN